MGQLEWIQMLVDGLNGYIVRGERPWRGPHFLTSPTLSAHIPTFCAKQHVLNAKLTFTSYGWATLAARLSPVSRAQGTGCARRGPVAPFATRTLTAVWLVTCAFKCSQS